MRFCAKPWVSLAPERGSSSFARNNFIIKSIITQLSKQSEPIIHPPQTDRMIQWWIRVRERESFFRAKDTTRSFCSDYYDNRQYNSKSSADIAWMTPAQCRMDSISSAPPLQGHARAHVHFKFKNFLINSRIIMHPPFSCSLLPM